MNIVFLTHPHFIKSQSMPRFAKFLIDGMAARGHQVAQWTATPKLYKLKGSQGLKKWLGYIDQYVVFPNDIRKRINRQPKNTLYVFTDHALGPWVPLLANKPHVVHCHDFLAQQSALGMIAENRTGFTGRLYQQYIHKGYTKGKYFIAVSHKTQNDLHSFLQSAPLLSEVVYNGLNQLFIPENCDSVRKVLSCKLKIDLAAGYILHVGGNQWYKNRRGVIEIYSAWRSISGIKLPLLMIGKDPDDKLREVLHTSAFKDDIYFISGLEDAWVQKAYAGASIFLFPSLAEGFGWPIAEAMASGCPVITTGEAPMTEVGGNAAFYIDRMPLVPSDITSWAVSAAQVVNKIVRLTVEEGCGVVIKGIENTHRFKAATALDNIESIYKKVLYSFK